MSSLANLRQAYHQEVCTQIVRLRSNNGHISPNFADSSSVSSRAIAMEMLQLLGCAAGQSKLSGQQAGARFEQVTRRFLEQSFALLHHLRPGE